MVSNPFLALFVWCPVTTALADFMATKGITKTDVQNLLRSFSPSTMQTDFSMGFAVTGFKGVVFGDESSENGVAILHRLAKMETKDQFNCVRNALSMAMKNQPLPTREVSLSTHLETAPKAASAAAQDGFSSIGSNSPSKRSVAAASRDSLSRSTDTKKTFTGSREFRRGISHMLGLLEKNERDEMMVLFRDKLEPGKAASQGIIDRISRLCELFKGTHEFDDDIGRRSRVAVEQGFKNYDWDRSFNDFIVGELIDYSAVSEPSGEGGATMAVSNLR